MTGGTPPPPPTVPPAAPPTTMPLVADDDAIIAADAADDIPGTRLLANAARSLASTSSSRAAAVEIVDAVVGIATLIVDSTLDASDPANDTRLDPIDFAFAAISIKFSLL